MQITREVDAFCSGGRVQSKVATKKKACDGRMRVDQVPTT